MKKILMFSYLVVIVIVLANIIYYKVCIISKSNI